MEPLLALRTTVSGLAKGVMDLSPRASLKSDDEFGELAQDLNHFLDRITLIVQDLDRILSEVVSVGTRLGALNRHLERQLDGLRDASLRSIGRGRAAQPGHAVGGGTRKRRLRRAGADAGAWPPAAPAFRMAPRALPPATLRAQFARLQGSFAAVSEALRGMAPPMAVAEAQSAEYQAFAQSLREMAVLEATMQKVAESGQQVLHRLTHAAAMARRPHA